MYGAPNFEVSDCAFMWGAWESLKLQGLWKGKAKGRAKGKAKVEQLGGESSDSKMWMRLVMGKVQPLYVVLSLTFFAFCSHF